MVVFDSPPILGLADAPLLSSLVEGTLLVVESERNRRGVLKGTLRRMRLAKGRVVGVALTKFDSSRAANYTYYYGYGYDYYAYENTGKKRSRGGLFGRRRKSSKKPAEVDA
jgi:polysaccharide biosynthesis transport protein